MNDNQTAIHTFHIPALHCPEEHQLIEKGLRGMEGLRGTRADYLSRTLRIEVDARGADAQAIEVRLRQIGFPGQHGDPQPAIRAPRPTLAATMGWSTLVAGALLVLAGVLYWVDIFPGIVPGMLLVATATAGWNVLRAAWRALRLRSIDMNVLMTIAAAGAIATGELFEAATAMFLFAVSLWLESYTLASARRAVQSLVQLAPAVAHRLCQHAHVAVPDGERTCHHSEHHHVTDIDPSEIRVHDLLLVKPGERMPSDGIVTSGSSLVNEAPITGESMPVEKEAGSSVFAGSLNGEGSLEIRASTTADQSTLAHVARLVEQAQASRSPTERFVDQFARRYTPMVIGIALLIAFGPPVLSWWGVGWAAAVPGREWLHRGLVLLVIACPCAFVISIPVTILCGLHQATRLGLLVKGGEFLEWAGKLRCVAFDKTGTLTESAPQLVDVRAVPGISTDEVLRVAAALEMASEHPLARVIVSAARERLGAVARADVVVTSRGSGVDGRVDGEHCFVGSARQALQRTGLAELPEALSSTTAGLTVAAVVRQGRLLGALYLSDSVRPDAQATVAELRQLRVESIVMLTGDSRATADRIAADVQIDDIHAELLPQDKVRLVEELVSRHDAVAMVGDGVNDAPALAAARVGVAFGTTASDTALETADVVSLSPHLRRIADFVRLGRRTRLILAQNITLALSIKAAVLCLALAGLGTLWAAVAADVGASMLVVLNGMRLLQRVQWTTAPPDFRGFL
ncbi:MAG: heavy metal translocating P-type ATPase [Pirellulaceae bacterium]